MVVKKQRNLYIAILIVFFSMNVLNTYFLTSQILNKYIAPMERSLIGEITAIFGNLGMLTLFFMTGVSIFKKDKHRFLYLTILTLLLNFVIFALGYFNLFYGTAFSNSAFDIFKNPAEGLTSGLFTELMGELFLYYRILVFVPFISLLVLTILYFKQVKKTDIQTLYVLTGTKTLVLVMSFFVLMGTSTTSYLIQLKHDDFLIGSTRSSKGIQRYGVYPYYFTNFMGINFENTTRDSLGITDENLNVSYQLFNKNKESYNNIIDGKTYSNDLLVKDSVLNVHDSLNLNSDSSLTGVFEDKNLVLVHMESLNYFLWQLEDTRAKFTFMNKLFEQSFVFENYYTSVGLGVSSDAEATVLTGLDMNGYNTFYRSYDKYKYNIDTLPKLFKDYDSQAFHADYEKFYNRDVAYPEMIQFTKDYFSLESFAKQDGMDNALEYSRKRSVEGYPYPHYTNKDLVIKSPWPSEFELSDEVYKGLANNNGKKQFSFSSFMTPHTPFLFNSMPEDIINNNNIKNITKRYLEFATFTDYAVESYLVDPRTGDERPNITNNVYVFYSDHGSSLKNGDIARLFNKKYSLLEERQMLQQTIAFIYAPSNVPTSTKGIYEGLITGTQKLARGHMDLYRTIGDMFGLFEDDNFYFGVSGFSKEPTFVIDNRIQDLVVDDINNIDEPNYVPFFLSLRNTKFRNSHHNTKYLKNEQEVLTFIKQFKKHSDLLLVDKDIYNDYKRTLQKS